MQENYVDRILKAKVYDVAVETSLEAAPRLSRRLDNRIWFKREDLQPVFSFKIRGAYNKIAQLSPISAQRGVICASAGNHAQGVALGARTRGIPAVIVMPLVTPDIKVQAVADLGAEIVLHGDDYDQAYERALDLGRERGLVFVHPFDDPDVIAGQGTIAMEILRQHHGDDIDAIFVPVGGGGLIAGIGAYVKSLYPRIKIIGVEPEDAAAMHESLRAAKRVTLERVGMFADGVAVRRVGEETFRIARQFVDEIILVTTDQICAAIQDIFQDTRSIAEPAGALAVAGIKKYVAREKCSARTIIAVNSGANMNFDRLRYVAERDALRVVARRGADHPALRRRRRELRDLVVGAANLERKHRLKVFSFEQDVVVQAAGQARRGIQRRLDGDVVHLGLEDAIYVVFLHGRYRWKDAYIS